MYTLIQNLRNFLIHPSIRVPLTKSSELVVVLFRTTPTSPYYKVYIQFHTTTPFTHKALLYNVLPRTTPYHKVIQFRITTPFITKHYNVLQGTNPYYKFLLRTTKWIQPFPAAFLSRLLGNPSSYLSSHSKGFSAVFFQQPFCFPTFSATFHSSNLSQQPFSATFPSCLSQQPFAAAGFLSFSQVLTSRYQQRFSATFLSYLTSFCLWPCNAPAHRLLHTLGLRWARKVPFQNIYLLTPFGGYGSLCTTWWCAMCAVQQGAAHFETSSSCWGN